MTSSTSYLTFREDLAAIYDKLQPKTVGCFDLAELSFIPLEDFVRGGSHAWFVDGEAGRVKALLAGEIARVDARRRCLACDGSLDGEDVCSAYAPSATEAGRSCLSLAAIPRDPARCAHFVPGRRLRVINGDARRGRGAGFATRVETVVARAATPTAAIEEAIGVCKRSAQLDIPLPIEDGSLDLVISVLAPYRLMEQPYGYFDELMTRRFGAWITNELVRKRDELRCVLFLTQLDAHVRELARLTHPRHGRMYFATVPVEPAAGTWLLKRGVTECFETLSRHFAFDFETFPAEAFLRRSHDDRSVVIQAALLRPRLTP